jgi:hypothetical protein
MLNSSNNNYYYYYYFMMMIITGCNNSSVLIAVDHQLVIPNMLATSYFASHLLITKILVLRCLLGFIKIVIFTV